MEVVGDILNFPTAFKEQRADSLQDGLLLFTRDGFKLVGRHRDADVMVLQKNNETIMLNLNHDPDEDDVPLSYGVYVRDPETQINLAKEAGLDVFDGGPVGSLMIHHYALRLPDERIVYLIPEDQKEYFYNFDFQAIEE